MIELKPAYHFDFVCPECEAKLVVERVTISGMCTYAECTCSSCQQQFYNVLPVSHWVETPLVVRKSDTHVYGSEFGYPWLVEITKKAFPPMDSEVVIEQIVYKKCKNVILLNTLDFLYGHALLKLYNAQHYLDHHPDIGLVVIIPKILKWMIPTGCAEAWIVDVRLNKFVYGYKAIARFVEVACRHFDTVYLSKAYSHPDFTSVDIARFTRIKPFELAHFYKTDPCITFVLREDRWWFSHPADYWFYRLCRWLKWLKMGHKILSYRQNNLVRRTIKSIRREMPSVGFYVVGIGKAGGLQNYAVDKRTVAISSDVEREWCAIYSKSQVVVGVHGSNMLLPTAFAAGCIEILPEDRFGNMIQDISVRYADRRQLFFYRFAEQYAKPKQVAQKAMAILRDYGNYVNAMCVNIHKSR